MGTDNGVKPMQVGPPPAGSNGSIQQNNIAMQKLNTDNTLKARFGGSRKILKGGLVVPPMQVSYKDTGAGNTSVNDTNTALAIRTASANENSKYDSQVGKPQTGGRRLISRKLRSRKLRSRKLKGGKLKGGWPDWGCMSGGRKRRIKRSQRVKNSYRRRKSK